MHARPAIVVCPWQVVAYNLSLTAPEDNCTEFMATSLRQAQMLFGEDSVTEIGTNGAHYKGALLFSNVTLIDPSNGSIGAFLTLRIPTAVCALHGLDLQTCDATLPGIDRWW